MHPLSANMGLAASAQPNLRAARRDRLLFRVTQFVRLALFSSA
jgi:hypothetical protein